MSTRNPRSAASSHSTRTLSAPSAIVRSKCGMPPTTSTPGRARASGSRARRRAQHAVLRECHELQVDIRRHASLHLAAAPRPRAAADRRRRRASGSRACLGDRPVAIRQRAFDDRFRVSCGFSSPQKQCPRAMCRCDSRAACRRTVSSPCGSAHRRMASRRVAPRRRWSPARRLECLAQFRRCGPR